MQYYSNYLEKKVKNNQYNKYYCTRQINLGQPAYSYKYVSMYVCMNITKSTKVGTPNHIFLYLQILCILINYIKINRSEFKQIKVIMNPLS